MKRRSRPVINRTKGTEGTHHDEQMISGQRPDEAEAIARRAFEIFEIRGGSPGHDLEDWLRAESEILHTALTKTQETNGKVTDQDKTIVPTDIEFSGTSEATDQETKNREILPEWSVDRIFRSLAMLADLDSANVSQLLKEEISASDIPKARRTE